MSTNNSHGFSMVEVMVAAAMLGGLALGVSHLMGNMTKSNLKAQTDSENLLAFNEMISILSDPDSCMATFSGMILPTSQTTTVTELKRHQKSTNTDTPKFTVSTSFGNNNMSVQSYTIGIYDPATKVFKFQANFAKKSMLGPGTTPKTIEIYAEGPNGTAAGALTICRSVSTASTDIWSRGSGTDIFYGGNVGIGGSNIPAAPLEVFGNVQAQAFMYSSDARLKENVHEIPNALDRSLKLHGVMFDWKNKKTLPKSTDRLGLIAQEVEDVFPEAVTTNPINGMKAVEYANLIAPIIEALKEQQAIILKQQEEIESIKKILRKK